MKTQTHRIAICRCPGDKSTQTFYFDGKPDDCMQFGGWPRASEIVTVEFPMLPPEVTTAQEVRELDIAIAAITEEFAKKLDALKSRKAELLAITHEEPA